MAYIGQRPTTGENNSFKVLDDVTSYTLTFDGMESQPFAMVQDYTTTPFDNIDSGGQIPIVSTGL